MADKYQKIKGPFTIISAPDAGGVYGLGFVVETFGLRIHLWWWHLTIRIK